jgi:hypothetical protein
LNTTNLEVIEQKEESGKFRQTWHHAAVARGGAAMRLTAMRVAG